MKTVFWTLAGLVIGALAWAGIHFLTYETKYFVKKVYKDE